MNKKVRELRDGRDWNSTQDDTNKAAPGVSLLNLTLATFRSIFPQDLNYIWNLRITDTGSKTDV